MRATTALLLCGAVAGPMFLVVATAIGASQPGYDPARMPISVLAVGNAGWMQTLNFLVSGLLQIGFAVGAASALRDRGTPSRWGPLLLGVFGLGLIGAGIFTTDPGFGYPPATPTPPEPTLRGTLHDLVSVVAFTVLAAQALVFARLFARSGEAAWAAYSALSGALVALGFVLLAMGFSGNASVATVAGLIQRGTLIVGWGWVSMFALHLLRSHGIGARPSDGTIGAERE